MEWYWVIILLLVTFIVGIGCGLYLGVLITTGVIKAYIENKLISVAKLKKDMNLWKEVASKLKAKG